MLDPVESFDNNDKTEENKIPVYQISNLFVT